MSWEFSHKTDFKRIPGPRSVIPCHLTTPSALPTVFDQPHHFEMSGNKTIFHLSLLRSKLYNVKHLS